MVPSRRQIEQQVAAVLQRASDASVVGIHASRPGQWPESIRVGAREFRLAWCESPLAARESLVDKSDESGLVLLTGADDTTLGADLLARLWRGRVFHLQSWDLVRDLFKAREIDPRLAPVGWIADLLVEQVPPGGYAPAPGGFLSADLAWQQVLAVCLGLGEGRPDAVTLVEWTLREDASVRFGCIDPAARDDLTGWLVRTVGPAARPILAGVAAGRGAEVLPIGLVCELIFSEGSDRDPVLSAAAARLERYTDGQRVDPVAGRRWGEAAAAVLARLDGGVDSTLDPLMGGVEPLVTGGEQDADDGAFAARGWRLKPPLQVARGWQLKPPLRVGGWGESRALRRTLLAQADRILDELGLGALAESSDLLQAGLDARLARYAEALATALAELERSAAARSSLKQSTQEGSTQQGSSHQGSSHQGSTQEGSTHQGSTHQGSSHQGSSHQGSSHQGSSQQGSSHQGSTQEGSTHQGSPLERAEAAAERVLAHRQTASWPLRRERLRMSLRLLRWLARPEPAVGDFATAAESYAADGAFVDWARMTLLGGEELASLSAAYAALVGAVRTRRESFNRRFAGYLVEWNRAGGGRPGLVPVEGIIEALLAPLAARTPVLLLVADGMSLPLFRALTESLNALGWTEAAPLEGPRPVAGVAVLPTLTEGSRTSLLCGRLTLGTAAQERSCFGTHPALTAVSRPDARPLIFHKADLGDGGGLAERVREAIRAPDQKLVCVVYNAVDDHLSGSDQLHLTWTVDDLRLLGPLLHEAGLAGRALLITADHGHVLEDGTTQRGREGNARWRVGTQPLDDEIALCGGRVLASAGVEQVILPWSEQVRYAAKRNGYHGGATPQEVLTPLAVLLPPVAQALAGWRAVPPIVPEWWESSSVAPPISSGPEPAMVQAPRAGRRRKTAPGQDDLFATQTPAPAPSEPPWLDALLASPVYAAQKRLAARMAPTDDDLRRFLLALDSRGGKLGKSALAQRLGLPMIRIEGFLSLARRVLNVDRAAVIAVDSTTGTVELNLPLLRLQFQLETD